METLGTRPTQLSFLSNFNMEDETMSINFKQCTTVAEAKQLLQSLDRQTKIDLYIALNTVEKYVGLTMFADAITALLKLDLGIYQ